MWNAHLGANRLGTVVNGQGYYVNFFNTDGSFLGTTDVQPGGSVNFNHIPIGPDISQQWNFNFTGWNVFENARWRDELEGWMQEHEAQEILGFLGHTQGIISNINSNRIAVAGYHRLLQRYTITFRDAQGRDLATLEVDYGTVITPEQFLMIQVSEFYYDIYRLVFSHWVDFEEQLRILDNLVILAGYNSSYREFRILFDGNGGRLVSGREEQFITFGQRAVPPVFEREGFVFLGWENSINYISVSGYATVRAIWMRIEEPPSSGCGNSSVATTAAVLGIALAGILIVIKRKG